MLLLLAAAVLLVDGGPGDPLGGFCDLPSFFSLCSMWCAWRFCLSV